MKIQLTLFSAIVAVALCAPTKDAKTIGAAVKMVVKMHKLRKYMEDSIIDLKLAYSDSYEEIPISRGLYISQQAHDVRMTSDRRRCDVTTSHRRRCDVILTSCARVVISTST